MTLQAYQLYWLLVLFPRRHLAWIIIGLIITSFATLEWVSTCVAVMSSLWELTGVVVVVDPVRPRLLTWVTLLNVFNICRVTIAGVATYIQFDVWLSTFVYFVYRRLCCGERYTFPLGLIPSCAVCVFSLVAVSCFLEFSPGVSLMVFYRFSDGCLLVFYWSFRMLVWGVNRAFLADSYAIQLDDAERILEPS